MPSQLRALWLKHRKGKKKSETPHFSINTLPLECLNMRIYIVDKGPGDTLRAVVIAYDSFSDKGYVEGYVWSSCSSKLWHN